MRTILALLIFSFSLSAVGSVPKTPTERANQIKHSADRAPAGWMSQP
jgi:hypothetical protein